MRRVLTILIAVLALAATACGGATDVADDSIVAPTSDATTAPVEGSAPTPTEAPAPTGAPPAEGDSTADGTPTLDASGCQDLAESLNSFPNELANAATGQVDVAVLQAQADAFSNADVPEDLADDFGVVGQALADIASTLGNLDLQPGQIPDVGDLTELQSLGEQLSGGAYTEASQNITAFVQAGCV